jgi:hypothetical protein
VVREEFAAVVHVVEGQDEVVADERIEAIAVTVAEVEVGGRRLKALQVACRRMLVILEKSRRLPRKKSNQSHHRVKSKPVLFIVRPGRELFSWFE